MESSESDSISPSSLPSSSLSENTYSVNNCLRCDEIMPLYEQVCYCGGPVTFLKINIDKKTHALYYQRRKLLYGLRKNT